MFKGTSSSRFYRILNSKKLGLVPTTRHFASEANPTQSKAACGLILSRIPLITKEPSRLEKLFWEYHDKKLENESLPFSSELYFKKGSLNERKWKERQGLIKANEAEETEEAEIFEDPSEEENKGFETDVFDNSYKGNSRTTEADKNKDIKSLERALENHLYLVTKSMSSPKSGHWEFPKFSLQPKESLAKAAERELSGTFGNNLDFWQVGNSPIGHLKTPESTVFFMKAHILAGQVDIENSPYSDFAWLTSAELETHLSPEHFAIVKILLS